MITLTGNINDVITQIKTLVGVFGGDSKLSDISRYITARKIIQNQLKNIMED